MRFEGRTAIITGAASGMGLLTSQKLAEEGAIVYMADINEERLECEAQAIRESGGRAIACVTDLREYDQIFRTAERVMKDEGHIDILVNFAGGFPPRMCGKPTDFLHEDLDVIDWGIQVNFRAPMLFDRVVLGHMIDNKRGVIIHIGSVDGETGGGVDYAAEKSGLTYGLTKAIARVGAPYGVRCCGVTPGPVLTRASMANMETAMGRAAEPIEVVKLVLYLCSDDAAFITGSNHLIEGGRVLLNNA